MSSRERPEREAFIEFCCPRCGSNRFDVDYKDGGHRRCRGNDETYRSCGFTYPVADMWKYMVLVERTPFESEAQYNETRKREDVL